MSAVHYPDITAIQTFTLEQVKDSKLGRFIEFKASDECWPWKGSRVVGGYGALSWKGKYTYAHRLIYELLVGKIPPKHIVMHLCNFPPCCNPKHLKAGTHRENMLHMWGHTVA